MARTGPILCHCKIVRGRIVHCALHASATYLVGVCEHLYDLLRKFEIHDRAEKAHVDQVVLPFIERTINSVMSEQKDGLAISFLADDENRTAEGRIALRERPLETKACPTE